MPFLTLSGSSLEPDVDKEVDFRLRFGFDVLKWIVLILLPLFLVSSGGLLSYEIYYEFSTTSGKANRFQKLVS